MRGQKQDLMKQKHNFQNTSQHNARTVLLSIYKERLLTTWNYTYRNLECVHTLPDRFSAAWKKILVRAFVHIRERLWWRDFCNGAKLRRANLERGASHFRKLFALPRKGIGYNVNRAWETACNTFSSITRMTLDLDLFSKGTFDLSILKTPPLVVTGLM